MTRMKKVKRVIISLISIMVLGSMAVLGGLYWAGGQVFGQVYRSYFQQQLATWEDEATGQRSLSDITVQEWIEQSSKPQPTMVQPELASVDTDSTANVTINSSMQPESAQREVTQVENLPPTNRAQQPEVGEGATLQDLVDYVISQISAVDKMRISALIMNNLSTADIEYLAGMALTGYGAAEIQAAKTLAYQRFDESQMEQVYHYYNKYSYLIP